MNHVGSQPPRQHDKSGHHAWIVPASGIDSVHRTQALTEPIGVNARKYERQVYIMATFCQGRCQVGQLPFCAAAAHRPNAVENSHVRTRWRATGGAARDAIASMSIAASITGTNWYTMEWTNQKVVARNV